MSDPSEAAGEFIVPSPQDNYQRAVELGFETLGSQSDEQLRWLGAEPVEDGWGVPVLEDALLVNPAAGAITTSAGEEISAAWRILVLHYLMIASRPPQRPPQITFSDLGASRSYAGVYQGRVIFRLCGTAGRTAEKLAAAAAAIGGEPAEGGDLGFDFEMFPRVSLRLIWHAPDDEFPPSATLLLPENIEEYFCAEDIVVLSESLVARLGGRPF